MSKLSSYIEKQLEKGFSLHEIRSSLKEAGHDILKIEKELMAFEKKEQKKVIKFSKKHIIILSSILVILIIMILLKMGPTLEKEVITHKFEDLPEKEQKTFLQIKLEECNLILNSSKRNICLLKAAKDLDSTEICKEIPINEGDYYYYSCLDMPWSRDDCGYESLIGERDICLQKKDDSFYNLAIKELNISYCNIIINGSLKNECAVLVDTDLDKKEIEEQISQAIESMIKISNNKEICYSPDLNFFKTSFCMASNILNETNIRDYRDVSERDYYFLVFFSLYFRNVKSGDVTFCENSFYPEGGEEYLFEGKRKELCIATIKKDEQLCYEKGIVDIKGLNSTCLAWVRQDETLCPSDYFLCNFYFHT